MAELHTVIIIILFRLCFSFSSILFPNMKYPEIKKNPGTAHAVIGDMAVLYADSVCITTTINASRHFNASMEPERIVTKCKYNYITVLCNMITFITNFFSYLNYFMALTSCSEIPIFFTFYSIHLLYIEGSILMKSQWG
jgi:hypothetical protein